jgi:hypothetical protein
MNFNNYRSSSSFGGYHGGFSGYHGAGGFYGGGFHGGGFRGGRR